jgi:hypothetical protein
MRKFIFTAFLAFLTVGLYAQKIDDVKDLIGKAQWDQAKEKIDAYLANEKNATKAEGWYYKGVIYNELAKDEKYAASLGTLDGRMEAFNAFKKYIELDPKTVMMTLEQNVRLFDIYNGYFDMGAKAFNSKNYADAYTYFKNASIVEDFVAGKGYEYNNFKFPQMDTSLIQNIALSALLAKNEDDAAVYYRKLADAKIKSEGFLEIYQFLVEYYTKKNDMANRSKYLEIGRQLYPESPYWCEVELKGLEDDKQKLFAKYDELISGSCKSYTLLYNYGAELFNYLYTQDKKPDDYLAQQTKLEDVLKAALALEGTPEANLLMARHMYNVIYDRQDAMAAIKGTKPEDVKKKNDLKAEMNAELEKMVPYAKAAAAAYEGRKDLKVGEKGSYKIATDLIIRYYDQKNDKVKVKEYQDKMKAIDN